MILIVLESEYNMAKKVLVISISIVAVIFVGLSISYLIYGSTLVNANDEKSISDYLSYDKNKPIEILAKKSYKDYVAVLYTDPIDKENGEDDDFAHFYVFKKHKLYKDKYVHCAGSIEGGNIISANVQQIEVMESSHAECFIYNVASNETKCIVLEDDLGLNSIRKLDEIDVVQTPYIIVKEYDLLSKYHYVNTVNGTKEIDYDNFYNENWEQTDKEIIESMLLE